MSSSLNVINAPSHDEIIAQFSSDDDPENTASATATTPWGEIANDTTSNAYPSLEVFTRLWFDATMFTIFSDYFSKWAPAIDCENMFQMTMFLLTIFLLAHGYLAEALPIYPAPGPLDDLHKTRMALVLVEPVMIDDSVLVYAYA